MFETGNTIKPARFLGALAALLLALVLLALPARAEAEDYDTALDQLGRLQALAQQYVAENSTGDDAIILTLAYTRTGDYNNTIWQLTAGARDPAFESYVNGKDDELAALQQLTSVALPNGEVVDFGHLLAAMNLVYKGMPITGSWGGDCMQLAQFYLGQAGDADGYAGLMQQTFNINDDGSVSRFGDQDLRADLDSVNMGATLTADTDLAGMLRSYYENLTDYDRAYQFIARSYGSVDTSQTSFRDTVYTTLTGDAGMQLLLYMNQMWTTEGWRISDECAPALRAACNLFADYLAGAVNNEKVKSEHSTLMITMASQALADALTTLGDPDAASAALAAGADSIQSTVTSTESGVDSMLTGATQTIKGKFDARIFEMILLVIAAAAMLGLVICVVMVVKGLRR